MDCKSILAALKEAADPSRLEGMARYGIDTSRAWGVSMPLVRQLAKAHKKNHPLALALWQTQIHEARILASLVADPALVEDALLEAWAADFASWDLCDQCCSNLFRQSPLAWQKAQDWCQRPQELVRRAGFTLIACMAVHHKKRPDADFLVFFPLIAAAASDERNLVKKAVNWALRQMGKRSLALHQEAMSMAQSLAESASAPSRWIGKDALRELQQPQILARIKR